MRGRNKTPEGQKESDKEVKAIFVLSHLRSVVIHISKLGEVG
jgi:hypothetical protein